MEITPRSKLRLRLQNLLFLALFATVIGLLAWLSTRYELQADWSTGARNSLSDASRELLKRLEGPVSITAFARDDSSLRKRITVLVNRYQRHRPDITLAFVNPDTVPSQVRELGISRNGELYLEYRGRSGRLQELTEQGITNTLQSLSRRDTGKILFLTDHGERAPEGRANHDLGNFGRELQRTGASVGELSLARHPYILADTAVLVIAGPQTALLPGETKLVQDYLDAGGNLLWLAEPDESPSLAGLAEALGIRFLPGIIVDTDASSLGIDNPAFALVADYGPHAITAELRTLTLFPLAAGLDAEPVEGWEPLELLATQPRAWTETDELSGNIRFNEGTLERAGPLTIGIALTRQHPARDPEPEAPPDASRQRVVVIGDGDFLSNAYLGNGGNLDLGLNIINWLSEDDNLLAIRAKSAPDLSLQLSRVELMSIAGGFLLVLPAALLSGGWTLWLRRRRR